MMGLSGDSLPTLVNSINMIRYNRYAAQERLMDEDRRKLRLMSNAKFNH